MSVRIHCLRHVPFEGPAGIEEWARAAGHRFAMTDLWRSPAPTPPDFDLLVVMGGPMSVHDEASFPFLVEEKRLIARAIEDAKGVLGVCLGAQLLAQVLGARVYRGPEREIGWFPVRRVDPAAGPLARFPETFRPLHWHGETFELPAGAQWLAASEAYPHQAFQLGPHVLALQFHVEATPGSVRDLVDHAGSEIGAGRWEEPASSILARAGERSRALIPLLSSLLAELTEGLADSHA